jgi:RES domain-containing protein
VALVTFRVANHETPLWTIANSRAGRYNRIGTGPTQYLSLHPMTPWAEVLRGDDRRSRERALMVRYPMWAVKVDLDDEPAEITFANAGSFGLAADQLVSDDLSACQDFAEGQRNDPAGIRAFVAPSGALPGTRNLVLLDPAVVSSYESMPLGPEDLPTAMVAQDGRCPEGLWDVVHYRGTGTPHPEYDAWLSADEFVFAEPAVSLASDA